MSFIIDVSNYITVKLFFAILLSILSFPIIFLYSIVSTSLHAHPKHKSKLASFVSVLVLISILFCLFIIPLDITNSNSGMYLEDVTIRNFVYGFPISIIYIILFTCMILFTTFLVPFAYLYFEAGDNETPIHQKILSSLKYNIFTLLALIIVLLIAAAFSFIETYILASGGLINNIKNLNLLYNWALNFASIIVAIMALIGLLPFIIFTGAGLGSLPLSIIGPFEKKISFKAEFIEDELELVQERINTFNNVQRMGRSLTKKQSQEFSRLLEKRKLLENNQENLKNKTKSSNFKMLFKFIIKFFKILFAIILKLIIIILLISLVASFVYRGIKSNWNFLLGFNYYTVFQITIFNNFQLLLNPLDLILVMSNIIYPLDIIILIFIIILFIWATVHGIKNFWIGNLNFLTSHYTIQWKKSHPEGLLIRSVLFMFSMITFFFLIYSFAPQYISFGGQKYYDSKSASWKYCDYYYLHEKIFRTPNLHSNMENLDVNKFRFCYFSEIAKLTFNINTSTWGIFGTIFYVGNIFFVISSLFGFIVSILWLKPKNLSKKIEDDDSDSDYLSEIN